MMLYLIKHKHLKNIHSQCLVESLHQVTFANIYYELAIGSTKDISKLSMNFLCYVELLLIFLLFYYCCYYIISSDTNQ